MKTISAAVVVLVFVSAAAPLRAAGAGPGATIDDARGNFATGNYREALKKLLPPPPVEVRAQPKTLDQRIEEVLGDLQDGLWKPFDRLIAAVRTREEMVLTFLALLELVRTRRIALVQTESFGEIRVKAA